MEEKENVMGRLEYDLDSASTSRTFTDEDVRLLYEGPLRNFRATRNPFLQKKLEANPCEIILPGGEIALGMTPVTKVTTTEDEVLKCLVYSNPSSTEGRQGFYIRLFLILVPIEIMIVTAMLFDDTYAFDETAAPEFTQLSYACTIATLVLGVTGVWLREPRVMTVFIVAFNVDAAVNLLRLYSILQFAHFLVQMAICHVVTLMKSTMMPSWFWAPSQSRRWMMDVDDDG